MTVRVVRVYALACDASKCDEWSDDQIPQFADTHKVRSVRRQAHDVEGWVTSVERRDYCPQHRDLAGAA